MKLRFSGHHDSDNSNSETTKWQRAKNTAKRAAGWLGGKARAGLAIESPRELLLPASKNKKCFDPCNLLKFS